MMTTASHLQTSGQTERFNKIIISRLCHYIRENQENWDIFVQKLT